MGNILQVPGIFKSNKTYGCNLLNLKYLAFKFVFRLKKFNF